MLTETYTDDNRKSALTRRLHV